MATHVLRVWLDDRPGALGLVASHLGEIGVEIVGIDILERGAGRAIDELAVVLPPALRTAELVRTLRSLDGVDLEDLRPVTGDVHDPRSDVLDTVALLVGAGTRRDLFDGLVEHGRRLLGGNWAAVVRIDDGDVVAADGPTPDGQWLAAFVSGSRQSARHGTPTAAPDVVWAPLTASSLAVVVGRDGTAFRARERRQVAALARIVDGRMVDVSRRAHPSAQTR